MGDALLQDIRYAFRQFSHSPGFATAAVLTLALAIGANTAIFTVLNALVIRELPIKDPGSLVGVGGRNALNQERLTPIATIDELERAGGPLRDLCAYHGNFVIPVEANAQPSQATLSFVTGGCFDTFGVAPILGRAITEDEAPVRGKGAHVAVISHRFWTRAFGADPTAIGRTIRGEGLEITIIGVLPPGFGGLNIDTGTELFVPFDSVFPVKGERGPAASWILGRLPTDVTLEQATRRLDTMWAPLLESTLPQTMVPTERADLLGVRPLVQRMGTGVSFFRTRYERTLTLILALTGLLLVVACVNLGGLLLARLSARHSELAVRMAIGGTPLRIGQQMLVDSLLLAGCGAVLAVPVSFAFIAPVESFMTVPYSTVGRLVSFDPDWRVLAVTAAIGMAAGVLMTALPIWMALRRHQAAAFTWDRTIARATNRWTRALLISQVALSAVMLIAAGLLARSVYLLQRVDRGLQARGVLTVQVLPVPDGLSDINNAAYYPPLLETIAALPGVQSAGFARMFPYRTSETGALPIAFVGEGDSEVRAHLDIASPGFFETLGVPLLAGRFVNWSDNTGSQQVAVVSQSLARALAPDGDVIGRHVRYSSDREHQDVMIVGVVGNATQGNPRRSDPLVFFRPALQFTRYPVSPIFVIRTAGEIGVVVGGVRQALQQGGREYIHNAVMLEDIFRRAPSSERMTATLGMSIAAVAIVLVFIGVHGALAYSVSRRTREIGVHLAVGATPGAAARTVIRESVMVTLIGLGIGLPAALVAARGLRALMCGVSEADPFTFVLGAAFFLAMGVTAAAIPARRAASVDPIVALRVE